MTPIEKDFGNFFACVGRGFGMDDISMKVFALLYLEPKSMAMDEIAKKTSYSLASISNTMKMLENAGIAQRSKKPGSKKVFFSINKNLATMNVYKMDAAIKGFVNPTKEYLPQLITKYKKRSNDKKTKEQIKSVESYYKQMLLFEDMIIKWKKDLENLAKKINLGE